MLRQLGSFLPLRSACSLRAGMVTPPRPSSAPFGQLSSKLHLRARTVLRAATSGYRISPSAALDPLRQQDETHPRRDTVSKMQTRSMSEYRRPPKRSAPTRVRERESEEEEERSRSRYTDLQRTQDSQVEGQHQSSSAETTGKQMDSLQDAGAKRFMINVCA